MPNFLGQQNPWAPENPFFEVKFINLEYIFYNIYTGIQDLLGIERVERDPIDLDLNINAPSFSFGFDGNGSVSGAGVDAYSVFDFIRDFTSLLLVLLITIIIYVIVRMYEIRKREKEYLAFRLEEYKKLDEERRKKTEETGAVYGRNPKWAKILELLFSDSETDWKMAIIECDTLLDELLDQLGFKGKDLGEKLKSADRETFRSLTQAWEAHTVRNRIAHEGMDYDLSIREARRVIALYEQVFREFDFV